LLRRQDEAPCAAAKVYRVLVRAVGGSVVVVGALLGATAAAQPAPQQGRPAVLVGAGLGLNGLGDLPAPLLEGHAGGGWRGPTWMAAALVAYTYSESEALLAPWSITRHDLQLVSVVAFRPLSPSSFNVHGQLGIGAAFDRLSGIDPETSERSVSASVGVGVGWGPAALTFRFEFPEAELCPDASRCFHAASGAQLLLSLTFDLVSVASPARALTQ
jgi:hypothetical protein